MKRFISIIITASIIGAVLSSCTGQPKVNQSNATVSPTESATEMPTETPTLEPVATDSTTSPQTLNPSTEIQFTETGLKTGLGIVTNITGSKSATSETEGLAQATSVAAAVTLDSAGKIVKCDIDRVQAKISFDQSGRLTTDKTLSILSTDELREGYGMAKVSPINKEWYQQADAFAEWTIGKTPEQVSYLNVKKVDEQHTAVPDIPELSSSVTITVGDFIEAIKKAAANVSLNGVNVPSSIKTGLAINTSIAASKDATEQTNGVGQADAIIAAITVDEDGCIVQCTFDTAQTKIPFTAGGELLAVINAPVLTKLELREDYGMAKASSIGKDWYLQAQAFAEWTLGKKLDDVKQLNVKKVDDNHLAVPDVPELATSVTISVDGYISAIEKAYWLAK